MEHGGGVGPGARKCVFAALRQEREEALRQFRCGEVVVLVATDVAARGLDIKGVTLVLCLDQRGGPERGSRAKAHLRGVGGGRGEGRGEGGERAESFEEPQVQPFDLHREPGNDRETGCIALQCNARLCHVHHDKSSAWTVWEPVCGRSQRFQGFPRWGAARNILWHLIDP